MLTVSDRVMRKAADVLVEKGLADVGFQYVSIDDCWMRMSPENFAARGRGKIQQQSGFDFDGIIGEVRDAQGNILPNRNFPDMKAMTDYIHAYGLKVGLYSSPDPIPARTSRAHSAISSRMRSSTLAGASICSSTTSAAVAAC